MLKLLLKTRILALADQFSGQSRGRRDSINFRRLAVLAGAGLVLLALLGYLVSLALGPLYRNLEEAGLEWLYFAMTGGAAFLLSFMFTSIYAQGAIYEARDNELLLSMPIPPTAILGSRIGALYLLNFFFAATFMATAGIVKLLQGGGASVVGIIVYTACVFLLALISTTLACLLGWLVSFITRRIRRKALFQLLISLLLLGAFYAIFLGDLNRHLQTITENSEGIAGVFRGVLYPFYALGVACTGKDLGMFGVFAACSVLPFALVCFVLGKSFIRIVTSKPAAKRQEYKAKALRGSSALWALIKKEMSCFFSNSSYMLNTGLGLVFAVGMTIMIVVTAGSHTVETAKAAVETAQSEPGFLENLTNLIGPEGAPLLFGLILALFASFTYISGPSISVEGNNIWILKSSPLRASQILKAKAFAHMLIALPFSLASSLIMVFGTPGHTAADIAFTILLPLLANAFSALCGVISNLYLGRLNFPSIAKAAKSNSAALIPMLSTLAVVFLPQVLYFGVLRENGMPYPLLCFLSLALVAALVLAMYVFLHSARAQARWDKVGR